MRPEAKKHKFNGNQQTAQIMTTQRTSRVTFRLARMVSGLERKDALLETFVDGLIAEEEEAAVVCE
jgi:hypothetical protein